MISITIASSCTRERQDNRRSVSGASARDCLRKQISVTQPSSHTSLQLPCQRQSLGVSQCYIWVARAAERLGLRCRCLCAHESESERIFQTPRGSKRDHTSKSVLASTRVSLVGDYSTRVLVVPRETQRGKKGEVEKEECSSLALLARRLITPSRSGAHRETVRECQERIQRVCACLMCKKSALLPRKRTSQRRRRPRDLLLPLLLSSSRLPIFASTRRKRSPTTLPPSSRAVRQPSASSRWVSATLSATPSRWSRDRDLVMSRRQAAAE